MTQSNITQPTTPSPTQPRFPLGQVVATPGVLDAFERTGQIPAEFLTRHASGDWGDLDPADKSANDHAVENGERLLSVYRLTDGTKVWIITESHRQVTTLLLPEEY